jgi:hypothetical protein
MAAAMVSIETKIFMGTLLTLHLQKFAGPQENVPKAEEFPQAAN